MPDTSKCNVAAAKFFAISNVHQRPFYCDSLRSSQKLGLFVNISKDHFLVSCTVSAVLMTSGDDGLDNDTLAKFLQLGKDEKPYR